MKFLHLSDIHLGKRLHGASLHEDQERILKQMLSLAAQDDVDAVLIAGDVYNRSQPQPEAISQFSRFLTALSKLKKPVLIVRGNHDGEAQLAYAAPLLAENSIFINEVFSGSMQRVTLNDSFGPVDVWLLPFIKPVQARRCFPEAKIENYADAVRTVIDRAGIDPARRNVLVTHQYVFGAEISDSEERAVGGLDQIPAEVFAPFDYVALGHLHKAQTLNGGQIRYCGAPLVYSFDECAQEKTATLVTLGEKGAPNALEFIPFEPLRRCLRLEGTLAELCARPRTEDFTQVILTDEIRPLDPAGALRITYPNLLNLRYADAEGRLVQEETAEFRPTTSILDHFIQFYTAQNGEPPTDELNEIIMDVLREGGIDDEAR